MRIHIDGSKISDNMDSIASSYCHKTTSEKLIMSKQGVLKCHKGKLFKLKLVDAPVKEDQLDRFRLICDSSEVTVGEHAFQVPTQHVVQDIIKKHHRLRPRALVELVIVLHGDKVHDFYFETSEDSRSHSVREDILTFLSVLKFC